MQYILEEIIEIMHNDYAGFQDKKGWDRPDIYRKKLAELKANESMSDADFEELIKEYLSDFEDKHMFFSKTDKVEQSQKEVGFQVRRYEDHLYITSVTQEQKLTVGMKIESIDGLTIPTLAEKFKKTFKENLHERQDWNKVLLSATKVNLITLEHETKEFQLTKFEKQTRKSIYEIKVESGIAFITLTDFLNPDAVVKLVEDNRLLLETVDAWIVDVRVNYGGSDSSFFPLLPYIMPPEGVDLTNTDEKMLFNCTEASAKRELRLLEQQLAETEDEQARHFLEVFKREWTTNRGKGFVEFDFSDILPNLFIKGTDNPKHVIVLSDYMCGSSGESFVELCKMSSKVTVIGRATMGLNDYANLSSVMWEEGFEFMYPTSRLSRIDKNNGMTGIGVLPDISIPWTPLHIKADVDMKKALELIGNVSGK
ncbi:S41 family peptidase [Chryseomicrobium aureum]|uniref:S41 family peptidase n=1 Tax=Chryseomicrobium aureum TaxID=1441723 RepID=UPI00370D39D5